MDILINLIGTLGISQAVVMLLTLLMIMGGIIYKLFVGRVADKIDHQNYRIGEQAKDIAIVKTDLNVRFDELRTHIEAMVDNNITIFKASIKTQLAISAQSERLDFKDLEKFCSAYINQQFEKIMEHNKNNEMHNKSLEKINKKNTYNEL